MKIDSVTDGRGLLTDLQQVVIANFNIYWLILEKSGVEGRVIPQSICEFYGNRCSERYTVVSVTDIVSWFYTIFCPFI